MSIDFIYKLGFNMEIQLSEYTKRLILKLNGIKDFKEVDHELKIGRVRSAEEPLDEGTPIIQWQWMPEIKDGTIVIKPRKFPKNITEEEKKEGFETFFNFLLHSSTELFYLYKVLENQENVRVIDNVAAMEKIVEIDK